MSCLFCEIAKGTEPSTKVWENGEFVCIKNKYPVAPVHLLVMPKEHVSKKQLAGVRDQGSGERVTDGDFWGKIMGAVFEVVRQEGLDKNGYKLVNNGAGYNHFDHEHIHVLGGSKEEPAGTT